jgi:hypothetical protein
MVLILFPVFGSLVEAYSEWNQKQRAKAKGGINAIFDLFGTVAVARPRRFKKSQS